MGSDPEISSKYFIYPIYEHTTQKYDTHDDAFRDGKTHGRMHFVRYAIIRLIRLRLVRGVLYKRVDDFSIPPQMVNIEVTKW